MAIDSFREDPCASDSAPVRRFRPCGRSRFLKTRDAMTVTAVSVSQKVAILLLVLAAAIVRAGSASPGDAAEDSPVDLAVLPAVIEWVLPDSGRSNTSVRVGNLGREPLRIDARISGWAFADDGSVRPLAPDPDVLSGRMEVHPARLEIPPGRYRTLRLWLTEPEALPHGEHRALLQLRARGTTHTNLDLAVYAYRGTPVVRAKLRRAWWRWCEGQLEAGFEIVNDGERHVRLDGWLAIEAVGGAMHRELLPRTPVLPGTTQTLVIRLPWASGAPSRAAIEGQLGERDLGDWLPADWPPIACGAD